MSNNEALAREGIDTYIARRNSLRVPAVTMRN